MLKAKMTLIGKSCMMKTDRTRQNCYTRYAEFCPVQDVHAYIMDLWRFIRINGATSLTRFTRV